MNSFKDFNIKTEEKVFTGDKIKISKILNKPITVHDFKISNSKYPEKGNGECLHLQISVDNEKRIEPVFLVVHFRGDADCYRRSRRLREADRWRWAFIPQTDTLLRSSRIGFTQLLQGAVIVVAAFST